MHERAAGEQPACHLQRGADRISRLVDMHAREQRHPGIERPVIAHRIRDFEPVGAAKVEILLAVAGRDMHEAGARLGGHEVGEQHWHVVIVPFAAQRVGADRAGEFGALKDA